MTESEQDRLFSEAMAQYAGALARLARGYEADPDLRRDLEQELQVALWQSFAGFDGRCSLSTWVWRVSHNRATSYVLARKRLRGGESIEAIERADEAPSPSDRAEQDQAMALILSIIDRLDPPDRQILLLYLEGVTGAEIADVTGVSSDVAAAKIHRFKAMLTRRFAAAGETR
ncbi:RNA polymerase sigma factor [Sphingopyxis lindanitolerans]|uniref:RNA polymerase sigma factor n=1 Tax=Sphingopyxis lindanitolerans TaxID=2054227 RepID=UPI00130498A8|nr:sigma-70 family RNA polymerase sigma factor [Sphingopyxis lindanitolerans]